jgi:hypothetical protein
VAAARTGRWRLARHHLWRSARLDPRSRTRWSRVLLALVPALGRRVWARRGIGAHDPHGVGVPRQRDGGTELFLPWRYEENPPPDPVPGDAPGASRLVKRLARRRPRARLCLGLERHDDPVGLLGDLAGTGGEVLVATTDRTRTDAGRPLGPPSDPQDRREWAPQELALLLRSTGLDVTRTWRWGPQVVMLAQAAA